MDKIAAALNQLFEQTRIVFWYDAGEKMREEYEALRLEAVEKTEVQNNEFGVRYKLLRTEADKRHLLYLPYAEKPTIENWLLDLQLGHQVFHAEREAMYLQELGLDYDLKDLVEEHLAFFESKERRNKLAGLLDLKADKRQDIQFSMLAIVFQAAYPDWRVYVQTYAADFLQGKEKRTKELKRFGLEDFFWRNIARGYNYHSEQPSIYDFLLEIFSRNFSLTYKEGDSLKESRVLLSFWKDAASQKANFEQLSDRIAQDLGVKKLLEGASITQILEDDLFRLVDLRIISDLVQAIATESITTERLTTYLSKRKNKYWYPYFADYYACLEHALQLSEQIKRASAINISSVEATCEAYAQTGFLVDYHYRKFLFHYRRTSQDGIFDGLKAQLLKQYSNTWLLGVNNRFQDQIAKEGSWQQVSRHAQCGFFTNHVKGVIDKGQKLFVIISDALRYENGWQLSKEIQAENRYTADLDYMLTTLPSYTQLGMAALLPHRELQIKTATDNVLVDGVGAVGIQGRKKVLETSAGVRATAVRAEDFMKMNARTEGRNFMKAHDLMYIYHNRIDQTGDDTTSEDKLFEAVEEEIAYLKEVLKRIANINGTNILITADHGYLYQYEKLVESDFLPTETIQGEVWKQNRRFVLGKKLKASDNFQHFSSDALGLAGETDILLPKSIHRMRVKGAGSRYVHGGASLQEVVIPMLRVAKKRGDTTRQVDVDIIKSTDRITTNILVVSFLQKELVSDTVLPRKIRAYLQAADGKEISDSFTYHFDAKVGSERQREQVCRFTLKSDASMNYKNQRVHLVLESPVDGSNKWTAYREYAYTLSVSFTNDFDF